MKKSQTLLKSGTSSKYDKLNEGDLVFAFQCNRIERGEGKYNLMTNMDWSFDKETTSEEIKSFLGGVLGAMEETFGEKMVTEAILHYAEENNHLVMLPNGMATLNFKSKGLSFKDWRMGK